MSAFRETPSGFHPKDSLSAISQKQLKKESLCTPQIPANPFFGPSLADDKKLPLLNDRTAPKEEDYVALEGLGSVEEWKEEALHQWKIALPLASMKIFDYLLGLVSVCFVGHLGALELAAAALCLTVAGATGSAVLEGLAGAMDTLCGQAYGAGRMQRLGVLLQRAWLIMTLACLPIATIWFEAERVMVFGGQDPRIAAAAGSYMRCLIPFLFAYAWTVPVAQFLQAQSVVLPLAAVTAGTLMVHIPVTYLFIHTFGMGLDGAAWAISFSRTLTLLLLLAYLRLERTGIMQRCWGGWSRSALNEWGTFLALALPACAMVCLEWWCFAIMILLAGLLPSPELMVSAMSICCNVDGLCFRLSMGLGTAASVRVSNELGADKPGRARRVVQVATGIAAAAGAVPFIILLVLKSWWPFLFTHDRDVVALVIDLAPFLVLLQLENSLLATFSGILRGSGQQLAGSVINLVAYYGVGVPLGSYLAFWRHMNDEGLYWGLIVALTGQLAVLLWLIVRTDWQVQVKRAKELLGLEDKLEDLLA